jgi:transitional endoplasmic reticulum ATPase
VLNGGKKINKIKHIVSNDNSQLDNETILKNQISINEKNTDPILNKKNIPDVRFSEIGGIDEILLQIREFIELPLKFPDVYNKLGLKPFKGVLLHGDPGNGKTMIAKAIANEVNAHFIAINGAELFSKWVGESTENLRQVFFEANHHCPCIIFFDEIDAIGAKREFSSGYGSQHRNEFLNQLLTLMDGIESLNSVLIIASTNRVDSLDPALLRPGRFDYKIEIKNPSKSGILKILEINTRNMPLKDPAFLDKLSDKLVGLSGSEVVFVCKEAAMVAYRRSFNQSIFSMENSNINKILNEINITFDDFYVAFQIFEKNRINHKY